MTISSTVNRVDYIGTNSTDTYSYTFRIISETDLVITKYDTEAEIESPLTLTTDYTVTGVGEAGGGTIVLTAGNLAAIYTLTIRRVRPLTQSTDIRNQGPYYPETHEDALDHSMMIHQQQQDEIDRSLKVSAAVDPDDFDPTIPVEVVGQSGVSIITNDDGDGLSVGPTADAIENAQTYANAAAASLAAISEISVTYANAFNVKNYGALGDNSTDDTAAIDLAVSALHLASYGCLYFPPGIYLSSETVAVNKGYDILMEGQLKYTGSSEVPVLTVGTSGQANPIRSIDVNVSRTNQSDWTDEANIGVLLYCLSTSYLRVRNCNNNTIGIKAAGAGQGWAYNTCVLNYINNNKIGLDIDATLSGYCNENVFFGGRFGKTTGINTYLTRIGIRLQSSDVTYPGNNQNIFHKPSFELSRSSFTGVVSAASEVITSVSSTTGLSEGDELINAYLYDGTTIASIDSPTQITASKAAAQTALGTSTTIYPARSTCIVIAGGSNNRFVDFRSEGNDTVAVCTGSADINRFEAGYSDGISNYGNANGYRRRTTTDRGSSILRYLRQMSEIQLNKKLVFHCPNLKDASVIYDSSDRVMTKGFSWGYSTTSNIYLRSQSTNITWGTDYLSLGGSSLVGAKVDTRQTRSFLMYRKASNANGTARGGRVYIRCYDSSGSVLDNTGDNHPYVITTTSATVSYQTGGSKTYQTGADSDTYFYFEVKPDVYSIWVGIGGGTNGADIMSFALYTTDDYTPLVWPGYSGYQWIDRKCAEQAPDSGTWAVGEQVSNVAPVAEGEPGWICVTAGTPGIWKAMAVLAS